MNGRHAVLAIVLVAGFVTGALYLLDVQFADGGVFPKYSSLRSDPGGAKLLFDTLARIPGVTVERGYLPLEYVRGSGATGATIFLLGVGPESFAPESLKSIDNLAGRGNRVVVTMAEVHEAPSNTGPLAKTWHVRFGIDIDGNSEKSPRLFFSESTGWKTIERDGLKPMAIERAAGKGSVALFAGSTDFANGSIVDEPDETFPLISAAIGPYTRVIFDEEHFGIAQTGSIAGLVRRFRLTGMALGFAICAVLFVWRNATAFPPPGTANRSAREAGNLAGRTSRSGLLTLLRRHVPPSDLARVCWAEWLAANRRTLPPEGAARAEQVMRNSGDNPVEALREIQSIVHSKGTL